MSEPHGPNPYAPPQARIEPPPAEKGSAAKAVLIGFLADTGFTIAASLAFIVILGVYMVLTGRDADDVTEALGNPAEDSPVMIVLLVIGGMGSALGGFLCARIARHAELRLGAVLAVISLAAGLILFGADQSGTMNAMSSAITLVAVMFGAWIGARKNRPPS